MHRWTQHSLGDYNQAYVWYWLSFSMQTSNNSFITIWGSYGRYLWHRRTRKEHDGTKALVPTTPYPRRNARYPSFCSYKKTSITKKTSSVERCPWTSTRSSRSASCAYSSPRRQYQKRSYSSRCSRIAEGSITTVSLETKSCGAIGTWPRNAWLTDPLCRTLPSAAQEHKTFTWQCN